MGWEERNGNRYYYQKEREGGRVVSKYIGTGEFAALVSEFDRGRHIEREAERWRHQQRRDEHKRQRQAVDGVQEMIRALERATLLLNGYHTHKGQWRKRRE